MLPAPSGIPPALPSGGPSLAHFLAGKGFGSRLSFLRELRGRPGDLESVPTTEDNLRIWTETDWDAVEELWSTAWGSAAAIWWCSLLPRIGRFLPAGRILE